MNCGSLTCGEHGHRDPKPAFLCIECDVALQAGCSGWIAWQLRQSGQAAQPSGTGSSSGISEAGGASAGATRAAAALQELLPEGFGGLITSFDEWAGRRPYYGRLIELASLDLENTAVRLDEAARGYTDETAWVSRGVAIDESAEPVDAGRPGEISPGDFSALWQQLNLSGKGLLAAALATALVMNLPIWSLPPQLRSIGQIAGISFRDDFPPPGKQIPFDAARYR